MGEQKTALILILIICFALSTLPLVRASPEMWSQTYGGEYIDHATSLVETSDGGYALAGTSSFPVGIEPSDFLLIKTDAYGVMLWNQTYGGEGSAYAYALVETSDGGYVLGGQTTGVDGFDFLLIKTHSSGNMEWNHTFGGIIWDQAYSLVVTSDGGFALAGKTKSFGTGDYDDVLLIKTDANGIPEFPSWIILPLFVIATLAVIIYRKKLKMAI